MNLAIVGCGFVANYYIKTLVNYPNLQLRKITDINPERAQQFSNYYNVSKSETLEDILADDEIDLVLNLTNPGSHYAVSMACLNAGKHVYSEKPLAMEYSQALELVQLAKRQNLYLSSAPCNLLSETAQTIWKALREQVIGQPYVVYAEMDDGLLHKMPYKKWSAESGAPWPYKDEFTVGCTLEHAGYYVTWLAAFFGPVKHVSAFSSCLVSDKYVDDNKLPTGQDFSVACLEFDNRVVARLTCSVVAPHNHKLLIVGDKGVIETNDCWFYKSKVFTRQYLTLRRTMFLSPWRRKYPLVNYPNSKSWSKGSQQMDYCRGVYELVNAIKEKREPVLSADFSLHVNEVVLAVDNAMKSNAIYKPESTFECIEPMPWATH